ncbi:MAG: glycosyltransferase [Oscillospiraceae bacterium]|nr:glycosyltransferase [Oscillospiraceae bacterium]
MPTFSVVIPAHNEEDYIVGCLRAVRHAAARVQPQSVEVIVVANRCTDKTAALAGRCGAR